MVRSLGRLLGGARRRAGGRDAELAAFCPLWVAFRCQFRKAGISQPSRENQEQARIGGERHGDGGVQVLADTAGLLRRDARSQVKTAKTIEAAPAVRDAVESGRVSQANARRLAEAIEKTSAADVESDGGLLAKAASMRPEQFTREARRWATDRQGRGPRCGRPELCDPRKFGKESRWWPGPREI